MASRRNVSKKTRFEVFKRDKFTCQYCGRSSPEVVLNCDHIDPVANGGGNEILNLVTSCEACNAGKKDRLLDDSAAVKLQVDQLKQLEERRQQLEMLMQWKNELLDVQDRTGEVLSEFWERLTGGKSRLSEFGKREACNLVKKYSVEEVAEALSEVASSYVKEGTDEQFDRALAALAGCCQANREEKDVPGSKQLYMIRGIIRSRLDGKYFPSRECLDCLKYALSVGLRVEDIRYVAKGRYSSFTMFKTNLIETIKVVCGDNP